ncbi:beta-galactosidase [Microcella flavibacter]|uniref:beta-galactosidase n=1 Tax=Microcella flavibacter TaxID=1804990 RepID=UPI001456E825|nr:beta-galactosidase [Microcella flavibacter]
MHYGADYNPEQWPEDIWPDDVARMREAGVTMVSLGIFAWSRIQPAEGEFDFAWLDRVIDLLHAGGIAVDLATATASPPPWATTRYPEMLPQDADGVTYGPGSRQQYAPSSPVYRRLAGELVRAIGRRYAQHPAVVLWHVNNEYGCHVNADYSDNARDAFRGWLRARYGTIDALNAAWGTMFWSQRYGSFDEVLPPRKAPYSHNPGQALDFRRFTSDAMLECYLMEKAILREVGATQPITTNFMGPFKPADYAQWAPHVDVISDDAYPDPNEPESFRDAAMQRDLMRSLKPGTGWLLMEQATNALNWRPTNAPKAPGQMAALSMQSVARGADGILFFQWRQSRAGAEKFHSAMLPHAGTDTRTWREVTGLGERLAALPELPVPGREARVALVIDWQNWWAVEASDHPVVLDYLRVVQRWYRALHRRHVMVDLVPASRLDDGYDLAIAPALYLLTDSDAAIVRTFVEGGGHLLAGPFTDVVDESDRFREGGFLTQLGGMLGVRLEDFGALVDPASPAEVPGERFAPLHGPFGTVTGTLLAEELHLLGVAGADDAPAPAEVEARFTAGRRAGDPALTVRRHGRGSARYLATVPDEQGADAIVGHVLAAAGVAPVLPGLPAHVEAARRGDVVTVINHAAHPVTVEAAGVDVESGERVSSLELEPFGVRLLRPEA